MFEQILQYVKGSETATYALAFSTLAPLAYSAPQYLQKLGSWIWDRSTYSIDIHFSDAIYVDVNRWLAQNSNCLKFNRHWRLKSEKRSNDDYNEDQSSAGSSWDLVPSYGSSLFKHFKSPWLIFERTKEQDKRDTILPTDILHFTGFAWNRKKIDEFFSTIQQNLSIINANPSIFLSDGWSWNEVGKVYREYNIELLSSEAKEVIEDIQRFIDSKAWYQSSNRNVKYKRGYLFSGVPGSGKSTLVSIIAKKFGMNVYYLKAKDVSSFSQSLFSSIPHNSIILIEDIDTLGLANREDEPNSPEISVTGVSKKAELGNLLNLLDGLIGYEGSIFIATTNNPDDLDSALLRPGRVDVHTKFNELPLNKVETVFQAFYELESPPIAIQEHTIAKLQSTMIKYPNQPELAAAELQICL